MDPLEILARLNSDDPPSLDELASARDDLARTLRSLKDSGVPRREDGTLDLSAVVTLQEAYRTAVAAIEEMEAASRTEQEQLEDLLADIPDPDAQLSEAPEPVVDDKPRIMSVREAVQRLGLEAPARAEDTADVSRTEHMVMIGDQPRDDATWHDIGHAFALSGRALKSGRERVVRVTTRFADERTLPGTREGNTRMVDDITRPDAVSAAGGCCALPTPIYENPVLSTTVRPIRDSLPTFGVTERGSVEFFPSVCIPDSGAQIWTCDDDAAVDPENEETWKDCLTVECDERQTVNVHGIPVCLEIGNFQHRYAPEQWQAYIRAVAALQARIADVELFRLMREGVSSVHPGVTTGSTYVNLLDTVGLAGATIRQDQRYGDVMLNLWIADWVRNAIRADFRRRRIDAAETVEATNAAITDALANEGVRVTFSPDLDPILDGDQVSGPLDAYPDTAGAVLAPEGHFTFLDGGMFDLGTEIRDHDLNRQNMVAAFAESFEGLLARGCNAKGLDIAIETCDTLPVCPT
jgi:hypothetical protein